MSTQSKVIAIAWMLAALTSTSLSACGKFEVDPKSKGVSTNSDPLKAEEEERLRRLVQATPTPAPESSDAAERTGEQPSTRTGETADTALDEARRLFDEELRGGGSPNAPNTQDAQNTPAAPAVPVPAEPAVASSPAAAEAEAPATQVAPAPVAAPEIAAPVSAALAAKDLSDEAKGQLLLSLVEPTMRINFVLAKQRNEILALKKILDEKKSLSKEQQDKLESFKKSYLLVPEDSMDALLSRVDTIAFTIQVAPLLLETNWGANGEVSANALSARAQKLNTAMTDDAYRFRSGRLAVKGANLKDESRQIYLAELGYNPDSAKNESLEAFRLTQMEVERIMKLNGISTMLDNRIKEVAALLTKEATP